MATKSILILLLISNQIYSQSFISRNRQYEAGINLAAMAYLGDVQGNSGIGKPFIKDLNQSNTTLYYGAFFTYYPKFSAKGYGIRIAIGRGVLHGADSLIQDKGGAELARKRRNAAFKTPINEATISLEYHLTLGKLRPFIVAGLGMVKFNPKTYYNGKWIELRPLTTELIPYPTTALIMPIGLGFKLFTENQKALTIEVLYRYATTDFIDDVSTVYPSISALSSTARELSYRNSNYQEGDQRGDPKDMDNYFSLSLKYALLLKQDVKFLRKQSLRCPTVY